MLFWTIFVSGLVSITKEEKKGILVGFKRKTDPKHAIYCSSDKIEMYMAFALRYHLTV